MATGGPTSSRVGVPMFDRVAPPQVGARLGRLTLEDVWVVDPAGESGPADLEVEGGRLVTLSMRAAGGRDADGRLLVVPGFLDLHAHLREPGPAGSESVATALAAAAHGGFTRVCAMPNTDPPLDDAGAIMRVRETAGRSGSPVEVFPYGCVTAERNGRLLAPLGELADAGAAGFSDDGAAVADPALMRSALLYAGGLHRLVVEHAEEPALTADAEAHEGIAATVLGLRGAPAAGETVAVARDLELLAQAVREAPSGAGPRLHLTHVSCAGSVELIRQAKTRGLPVTCDVTPHHLALHDGWVGGDRRYAWEVGDDPWTGGATDAPPYDTRTRVNPPLREPSDAAALAAGLRDGTIDAIATDHAPHPEEAKAVEFGEAAPGISGIETAFGLTLAAIDAGVLDLATVIRALTIGPARALGLDRSGQVGRLLVGAAADLVVIDPSDGWEVTVDRLRSRGTNTPLLGRRLPGRVLLTVARGRVAYLDEAFAE